MSIDAVLFALARAQKARHAFGKAHMIYPLDAEGIFGEHAREICTRIQQQQRPWLEQARCVNRALHRIIPLLHPNVLSRQEMLVATLYVRGLTVFQAIVRLAEGGLPNECQILLRSMLELVIYQRAIHLDPELTRQYILNHDRERLRLFRLVKRSRYLQNQFPHWNVDAEIATIRQGLGKNTDGPALRVFAEKAGLLDFHDIVYKVFCGNVHSSVQDLASTHFDGETPETIKSLMYGVSDDDLGFILMTATHLALISLGTTAARFSIEDDPELASVLAEQTSLEATTKKSSKSRGDTGFPGQ